LQGASVLKYSQLIEKYEEIEATTKRLEMTDLLVELFERTPKKLIDQIIYLTQGKLYPDFLGIEIGIAEKIGVRAISRTSGYSIKEINRRNIETGDLGDTTKILLKGKTQSFLFKKALTVEKVYETFEKIAKTIGQGSTEQKLSLLAGLIANAEPREAKYLIRFVTKKLRLGIGDMTVLDALAIAYTGDKSNRKDLERAYNLSSDLGLVAKTIVTEGIEGIREISINVGKPIRPMLAERLSSAKEALEKLGGIGAAEYKLDGERLQIHKKNKEIRIFSRRLENITSHYPDIVAQSITQIDSEKVIVEGECVAIDHNTGAFRPFQELMHRRRKHGIKEAIEAYPVSVFFFDLLFVDEEDYTTKTYRERREKLEQIIIQNNHMKLVQRLVTDDLDKLELFFDQAIQVGCEGLVLKDLESGYRAGNREFSWIKWKREYKTDLTDTIDLVVVGGLHGKGRRVGKYGAFLLATFENQHAKFRTVCKCGTGFTDDDLDKLQELLEPIRIPVKANNVDSKMDVDVWFSPKLVIEVIASEITLSPIHTCGMDTIRKGSGFALRFPKYTGRLREDKGPENATTENEIIRMYKNQLKQIRPISQDHKHE